MTKKLEVNSNLMCSAGQWHAAHNGIALESLPWQLLVFGVAQGVAILCIILVRVIVGLPSRRIVRQPSEHGPSLLAIGPHSIETKLGADLQDRLLADDFTFGKLSGHAGNVFLFHGSVPNPNGHLIGSFAVFADEHDAAGQTIEAMTWHGIESESPIGANDLCDGVVHVSTGRMYGDASRLVYDDDTVVFMNNSNRLRRHGGFVSMGGMTDDIAILDGGGQRRDLFSIDDDAARENGIFLDNTAR
jgi:hypothetical protein